MTDQPEHTPKMIQGRRQMSMAALRERIEAQFVEEARPDMLLAADSDRARREMIREVAEYVLVVESLHLSRAETLALYDELFANLFRFGPLSPFFEDDTLSEITIDGPDRVYIRHGAADMLQTDRHFEDTEQLARITQRVLSTAGVQFSDAEPFTEVGAALGKRHVRLTIAAPPISPLLHVNIRLHPTQPFTLADLITREMVSQAAADQLVSGLHEGRGLMIAGDVGTGKTTLLQALLAELPAHSAVVERSAELYISPDMEANHGNDFALQIDKALEKHPPWLVLDEIRFDEGRALWAALSSEVRCLWTFRGATDQNRLRAAFNMSVRRAQPTVEQSAIDTALVDRLPMVALLARRESALRLIMLGIWTRDAAQPDTIRLVPLAI